jgi:FKBP12-rapamycin complex-associated protein
MNAPPEVVYAQLKLDWAESPSERCIEYLHAFASQVRRALESSAHGRHAMRPTRDQRRLLSRCYYKLGDWQTQLHEDWHTVNIFACG